MPKSILVLLDSVSARSYFSRLGAIIRPPLLFIALIGCALTIVPPYDQALIDGLNQANEETLVLFSSVSGGAGASTFSKYAQQYDDIIGSFDALRVQAGARSVPPLPPAIKQRVLESEVCPDSACVNPTPEFLTQVVAGLTEMKATHARSGLASDIVPIFKNSYETAIGQAMFVETGLKP